VHYDNNTYLYVIIVGVHYIIYNILLAGAQAYIVPIQLYLIYILYTYPIQLYPERILESALFSHLGHEPTTIHYMDTET